jgi:hypothetical protein
MIMIYYAFFAQSEWDEHIMGKRPFAYLISETTRLISIIAVIGGIH